MTTVMTKTTTKGRSPRFLKQADILRNDRLSMKKVNFEPKQKRHSSESLDREPALSG